MQLKKKISWLYVGVITLAGSLWLFLHPLLPVFIFHDELLIPALNSEGKWGFINTRGQQAVPFQWGRIGAYDSEGFAKVSKDERLGWIDLSGVEVLPFVWDNTSPFDDQEMAWVKKDGKWGCINRQGKSILPLKWDTAYDFDAAGMAPDSLNKKWGFYQSGGKDYGFAFGSLGQS